MNTLKTERKFHFSGTGAHMICPNDNTEMQLKAYLAEGGIEYTCYYCPVCHLKLGTIDQTWELQKKMDERDEIA